MLSVKDDFSSAILTADVTETCTYNDVKEITEDAVRLLGVPGQILSDHGTQWYAANGGTSKSDTEFCSKHDTEHIMGRIGKPTAQGKIERWHGSVIKEAHLPPKGGSVEEYGEAVLEYAEFCNTRRPRHGIGPGVPFNIYLGGLILPELFTILGIHDFSRLDKYRKV